MSTSELWGCVLASSAGALKSICVSLLELSPTLLPRSPAFTRSDRGGLRSGVLLLAGLDDRSSEGEAGVEELEGGGLVELWLDDCPCIMALRLTRAHRINRYNINLFYWPVSSSSNLMPSLDSVYFEGPSMSSRIVGLGRGFFRSCTLGRTLSSSRRKMVANRNRNAMTSKTWPRRASKN